MAEITVDGAKEYLGARLGGEAFTDETETRQSQALISAIDALAPYVRNIPDEDKAAATYEQALWLLGSRAELQSQGVTSFSVSGISETYDVKGRPAAVAPSAWRIIKNGADGSRGSGGGGGKTWLL